MLRSDLIRARKAQLQKTLEDLSNETGLNSMTISDLCNGKERNFGIESISKLADALQIPLQDLFKPIEKEKTAELQLNK